MPGGRVLRVLGFTAAAVVVRQFPVPVGLPTFACMDARRRFWLAPLDCGRVRSELCLNRTFGQQEANMNFNT